MYLIFIAHNYTCMIVAVRGKKLLLREVLCGRSNFLHKPNLSSNLDPALYTQP